MKAMVVVSLIMFGCTKEKDLDGDTGVGNGSEDSDVFEDTSTEDSGISDIDTGDTVDTEPVDGSQVASDFCNNCHVWNSPVWGGEVPEFNTVIPGLSETELADIIRNGTSGGMPSFSNLSQVELDALILYLMETYN